MSEDTTQTEVNPNPQESNSEEVTKEIEKLRSIKDEVVKQRDELKEKLRTIEETTLKENEKWKDLAELKTKDLEAKESELSSLTEFKTKYVELETALKSELLAELPDEHKELASDFDINKLRAYVKLNGKSNNDTDATKSGGFAFVSNDEKFDDYTTEELTQISEKNPELYLKLRKEKFKF